MNTINRNGESLILKLPNLHKLIAVFVLGVAMSLVLAACGGGGTSSTSAGGATLTGSLIDGYISGATVCLDANSNGMCDAGEPFATTGASGVFSIAVPAGHTTTGLNLVAYVPTTATDTDGPITKPYTMLAPVQTTATVVSPLTTLVALNPVSGVAGVATALGISSATITSDYIANSATVTSGAHNVAQYLAGVLASVQNTQSSAAPNSSSILSAVNLVTANTNFTNVEAATPATLPNFITAATAAPGAPTSVAATAGNTEATVTFAAPASNGSSAITGYTVTSNPAGGVDSNAGSTGLSHVITGLTNGTSYTFTVSASNLTGNTVSAASNSVTPAGSTGTPTVPTTAASSPAHTIVTSVLTTSAADIAGTQFFPNWGQKTTYTAATIGGVETAEYATLDYEGVQLAANIDVYKATTVHFDVWSPNVTSLKFGLISIVSGTTHQFLYTTTLTTGGWNSIDIPLSSFTGVDLTGINQLSFTGVTPATGGTIYVQNIYFWGSSVSTPTAPSTPTGVSATGGVSDAIVTFAAPANGGSVITGYTVTSNPAGGVDSNAGTTALTHTITGLTNGTAYTFTVTATNSVGTSVASAASNAVTPVAAATVPSAPTIGTATAGNAQATVTFTAPTSSGGSVITGYTVTSIPAGGVDSNANSTSLSHAITGLTNGTAYTFTVKASNSVGSSVASAASNPVTPSATLPAAPTTAANAPANTIKFSVLTSTGVDIAGTNFFPGWNQATQYTATTIGGVETAEYTALNYEGIALAANVNVSTAANVHFDVWTPDVTSLGFDLISPGPVQTQITKSLTLGQWNSIDIPLSSFSPVDLTNLFQLSFTGMAPTTGGTIYVQNIYFWGTAAAATAPGAPTIGTATAGNGQATVAFSAPSSNGGAAITGYTVTSNPAGGADSGAGSTSLSHTITGLTNGTSYTFTVTATNSAGTSVASAASNAVTPSGTTASVVTFSSGFNANGLTDQGGAYGGAGGSNLDNYTCNGLPASCGGGGISTGGAGSNFYYYYQTPSAPTGVYDLVYVFAPGVTALSTTADTAGVTLSGQTTIKFTFNPNPEWFNSTNHNFWIGMNLGKHYTVGVNACNLQLATVVTATSVGATTYTIPLSNFAVSQNCGIGTLTPSSVTAALALSPVSNVIFQGAGGASAIPINLPGGLTSGANTSVVTGGVYPTTVNITGGITFQ